jgi:hypothetical protein
MPRPSRGMSRGIFGGGGGTSCHENCHELGAIAAVPSTRSATERHLPMRAAVAEGEGVFQLAFPTSSTDSVHPAVRISGAGMPLLWSPTCTWCTRTWMPIMPSGRASGRGSRAGTGERVESHRRIVATRSRVCASTTSSELATDFTMEFQQWQRCRQLCISYCGASRFRRHDLPPTGYLRRTSKANLMPRPTTRKRSWPRRLKGLGSSASFLLVLSSTSEM